MNLRVKLQPIANRSYDVTISPGIIARLASHVGKLAQSIFIITDSNVERLYGRRVQKLLYDAGADPVLLVFAAGEESKNSQVVDTLHTQLLKNGVRRDSLIIALGGGVVGDVAGYVAATVLRGVKFVQVPTTLLSQVDSSVGGKVGVDHPLGKNLIGAFHQPSAVFIDPDLLKTLSPREFRNGLAEVVKIGAALDRTLFQMLERHALQLSKNDPALLTDVIRRSVELKAAVVAEDEFEVGVRKTLNLGHTFGHALETALNFRIKHGEAVAIGMVAESAMAVQLGLLEGKHFNRLVELLKTLKLPTRVPLIKHKKKFLEALKADKKSSGGGVKFVLLNAIGTSMVGVDIPALLIEHQLR